MNKRLMKNLKKVMLGIVIGASSLTTIIPGGYVFAATTNIMEQKAASVKIKDVTLTAKDIVPGEYDGSFIINMDMEKASGFPAQMKDMLTTGKANVEIGGKKIELMLAHTTVTKKISNTQAEVAVYVFAMKPKGGICEDIKLDQLKGKEINFNIESITYFTEYTTLTPEFLEQFKKVSEVKGVTVAKADIGVDQEDLPYIDENLKVLPHGGLAIPAIEGTTVVLDNIGFVDGKLNVRLEMGKEDECCHFYMIDNQEKNSRFGAVLFGYCGQKASAYCYNIPDMTALANYTPTIDLTREIAKDEEKDKQGKVVVKTLSCKF